jgi:hypothetical protein
MSESLMPPVSIAHAAHGRLRLRIHARRGGGHLDRLAGLLQQLPDVSTVRVNHAARTVTVTFDPRYLSGPRLVEQLCELGLTIAALAEGEWGLVVASRIGTDVANPATPPGRAHLKLLAMSGGRLHLVRVVAFLLVLAAALAGRAALLRGASIPWVRVLTYLSLAASLWAGSQTPKREASVRPAARP